MRILITGALGYVGYSVVSALLAKDNIELVLYDNGGSGKTNLLNGQKLINGEKIRKIFFNDILDNTSLAKALKDVDTVIHLAAKASTPFSDFQANAFDQINNWGTAGLIDAVEASNSVKHFIYLSSVSIYGNTEGREVDEDFQPNPHSFYGKSKLKGEGHVLRLPKHIKYHIIRSGNIFGYNPTYRIDAVINRFAFDANFKKRILIQGSGEQKRSFCSIHLVAKQIYELIHSEKGLPGIFNLVEFNKSINEIVYSIDKVFSNIEKVHSMQHMYMKSIAALSKYNDIEASDKSLDVYLNDFKDNFTFEHNG